MSANVSVRLLRQYRANNRGEVAGFPRERAAWLIEHGYAEEIDAAEEHRKNLAAAESRLREAQEDADAARAVLQAAEQRGDGKAVTVARLRLDAAVERCETARRGVEKAREKLNPATQSPAPETPPKSAAPVCKRQATAAAAAGGLAELGAAPAKPFEGLTCAELNIVIGVNGVGIKPIRRDGRHKEFALEAFGLRVGGEVMRWLSEVANSDCKATRFENTGKDRTAVSKFNKKFREATGVTDGLLTYSGAKIKSRTTEISFRRER